MTVLKYPFYLVITAFILLTVYSVGTEKPRQYRAKATDEAQITKPFPDIWSEDNKAQSTDSQGTDKSVKNSKNATTSKSSSPSTSAPTSVVAAFSNNDAGGKIVLTLTKCEKSTGLIAYTTAQDGKIDFGCWTFDELYIVVNWEKAGLNNYTYDRFFDISNEHLKSKSLFELTKDINMKSTPALTTITSAATANQAGGKK